MRVKGLLEPDAFRLNQNAALAFCLHMTFSKNRCPLFRIMLEKTQTATRGGADEKAALAPPKENGGAFAPPPPL